ncbi:hypothetical protein [Enterobacter sp.]|uniref:hypothetical protein n=1 Tax=Enterobacter sp. TaxID=42895 RepID=UPI00296F1C82|nr:hypothetical protein [Enterobacter sp.]
MADINELIARMKAAAQDEIMCREACDTSDLWQDEASPENVLALLEALEAAEKVSAARLEAIDRAHNMFQRERGRAEAAEARIAELEARTLTVKMPIAATENGRGYKLKATWAIQDACRAAGIKLQIEGEE